MFFAERKEFQWLPIKTGLPKANADEDKDPALNKGIQTSI